MENEFPLEEPKYRYVIGIDLGTTNSAVAFVDLFPQSGAERKIRFFRVPQLVGANELAERPVLPSFLYLPGEYELPAGSTNLPWDENRGFAVGEFAREQGSFVPGRLVSSAKSWLCHAGVDRTAPILPWGAGADVPKVSPVEASARYLSHLREAWNAMIARNREGYRLEEQLVVLTVPASFDEVARELTVEAAHKAGLPRVVLLEEPLAAFYSWLSDHEEDWQEGMEAGQIALVCDVGGGTTDYTIIAIREGEKGLRFDRLAVGEHLMLGGDNMDVTLARHVEMRLMGAPGKLDSRRWHQLSHQCRKAKEILLSSQNEADKVDITVMGTGKKLIADTLKSSLKYEEVRELILEGFFPRVDRTEAPAGEKRKGLTEWGLPYVREPAVTRHLAAFWQRHRRLVREETGRDAVFPEYILFNGGALIPEMIRNRVRNVVADWFAPEAGEDYTPSELPNPAPLLAVASGAAYYGLVRLGQGVRIGAGSPRSYYVEVAASNGRVPERAVAAEAEGELEGELEGGIEGEKRPEVPTRPAVCLVERGTEEGFETRLSEPSFQVITNRPVMFQLLSSHTRLGDRLGDVVAVAEDEITVLPPIRTVLRYGKKGAEQALPVELAVRLTEVGTLDLWCQSQQTPHKWQLQFDVRQEVEDAGEMQSGEVLDSATIEEAQGKIGEVFSNGAAHQKGTRPESLVKELAGLFDMKKEEWSTPIIRKLAETLLDHREGRRISPEHEARWLNLTGFCLRPGFGDPLDEWRVRECWKMYPQGLCFPKKGQGPTEWWIFWRRIAGGLSAGQQWHIYLQISTPLLASAGAAAAGGAGGKKKKAKKGGKGLGPQEEREVWMALANFERLPPVTKAQLGDELLNRLIKGKPKPQEFWSLSRFGARIPFYGPLDRVLPSADASRWLNALLDAGLAPEEGPAKSLLELARYTGDRERDLPEADRKRLADWLRRLERPDRFLQLLEDPDAARSRQEQAWLFGESLPSGLVLS
jgi:hypothetical protein